MPSLRIVLPLETAARVEATQRLEVWHSCTESDAVALGILRKLGRFSFSLQKVFVLGTCNERARIAEYGCH